jgi:Winged helix DNA-binding domain
VTEVLTLRQLNRATLARQLLLQREAIGVVEAVERLAGMQAQEPKPPFVGLWSRVEGFAAEQLHEALRAREVVRATLMRGTLHLASAAHYAVMRPALAPTLARALDGRPMAKGLEPEKLAPLARELLAGAPHTFNELRPKLQEAFPHVNDRALGYSVRMQLPLVMVPSEQERWGFPRDAPFALAQRWLGEEPSPEPDPKPLVRRYLAAFGPATVADAQTWSGIPKLKPAFEELRPELLTFEDERGRELFDLPDAPRPDADAPAPPRFLPEFDNLVLAHADRTRIVADEHRPLIATKNLRIKATFLLDGVVAGTWSAERTRGAATLTLAPFAALRQRDRRALEAEAERLVRWLEPGADAHAVRHSGPGG